MFKITTKPDPSCVGLRAASVIVRAQRALTDTFPTTLGPLRKAPWKGIMPKTKSALKHEPCLRRNTTVWLRFESRQGGQRFELLVTISEWIQLKPYVLLRQGFQLAPSDFHGC